jgi:hypothetical protein
VSTFDCLSEFDDDSTSISSFSDHGSQDDDFEYVTEYPIPLEDYQLFPSEAVFDRSIINGRTYSQMRTALEDPERKNFYPDDEVCLCSPRNRTKRCLS